MWLHSICSWAWVSLAEGWMSCASLQLAIVVIEATTVTDEYRSVGLRREVFYGECDHRRR